MILVSGATGKLGSAVVDQLLTRTDPTAVAVLARDPSRAAGLAGRGVAVRIGDYDDADSISRAMAGCDRVLLIASNDFTRRAAQHRNVIDAAVAAGVARLGFTSRSLRDPGHSHDTILTDLFQTEAELQASGLETVIFQNALYLDTLAILLGGSAVFEHGVRLPAGEGRIASVLRREMGEAMANAMLDPAGGDRRYVLAAARAVSFREIAEALSEIAGSPVPYIPVDDEDFVAHTVELGVPEPMAARITESFADIRDGQIDQTSPDLQTLLGRAPASLEASLAELFQPPAGPVSANSADRTSAAKTSAISE